MNYKPFIILLQVLFISNFASAQTSGFNKYTNTEHNISFSIPSSWKIRYSKQQDGIICVPVTKQQKDIYNNCFEGIVFRLNFYKTGLDATLLNEGYTKSNSTYYTSDRESDTVVVKNITGKGWKGAYHKNVCGITCKDNGFHAVAGACEFLYFSNGKITVCIDTNGKQLDDKVLQKLTDSFQFN